MTTSALNFAGPKGARKLSDYDPKLVREAQLLVGQTFFGTLMKQLRQSPFRSEMFDGGRGGQAFGSLYDQQLTERMSRGAGTKLVHAIVRKLDVLQAYSKQAKKPE